MELSVNTRDIIFEIMKHIDYPIIAYSLYYVSKNFNHTSKTLLFTESIIKRHELFEILVSCFQDGHDISHFTKFYFTKNYVDKNLSTYSAKMGNLDCLKYAYENGYPWNELTYYNASREGYLDCIIYLHKNGCPWDEGTCSGAAYGSNLDCLIYAHENGCLWDEYTCSSAASG